jgi:hypothetical protein
MSSAPDQTPSVRGAGYSTDAGINLYAWLYAWKISAPGRPDTEKIGSLAELESFLDSSGLPGASPSREIIARTLLMQLDGQGYYKSCADPDERWTLLWVQIGGR